MRKYTLVWLPLDAALGKMSATSMSLGDESRELSIGRELGGPDVFRNPFCLKHGSSLKFKDTTSNRGVDTMTEMQMNPEKETAQTVSANKQPETTLGQHLKSAALGVALLAAAAGGFPAAVFGITVGVDARGHYFNPTALQQLEKSQQRHEKIINDVAVEVSANEQGDATAYLRDVAASMPTKEQFVQLRNDVEPRGRKH